MDPINTLSNQVEELRNEINSIKISNQRNENKKIDRNISSNSLAVLKNVMPDTMFKAGDTNIEIGSDLIPDTTATYDLGSTSLRWDNIYGTTVDTTNLTVESINSGNARIIYHGFVQSTGSAGSPLPSGWTTAKNSTGRYTVTHSLGNSAYSLSVVGAITTVTFFVVVERNTANFIVQSYDDAGTLTDNGFYFILIRD